MKTEAILFDQPRQVRLCPLELPELTPGQIEVDIEHSGISTGTERLLWDGTMPSFPGMGYPLVPGYEAVGRIARVAGDVHMTVGQRVFVPGTRCWQGGVHSLFGASARRLHADHQKVLPVDEHLGVDAVLFAFAATAYHSVSGCGQTAPHPPPDLLLGHSGVMLEFERGETTIFAPTQTDETYHRTGVIPRFGQQRDFMRDIKGLGLDLERDTGSQFIPLSLVGKRQFLLRRRSAHRV